MMMINFKLIENFNPSPCRRWLFSFIPLALLTALCVGKLLYKFCKGNKIEEDHKNAAILFSTSTVVSAAIGVGLAAAISAIFPGAMLGMGSAALAGAVIGAIAPIAGFFVVDKVNDYIISPIVECFFSKDEGYKPV